MVEKCWSQNIFDQKLSDFFFDGKFSDKKILRIYGDEWIAGNLCYHLKSRPKCIIIHGKKYVEVATDMESILFKLQELKDLK